MWNSAAVGNLQLKSYVSILKKLRLQNDDWIE